jgi:hypothetical protein
MVTLTNNIFKLLKEVEKPHACMNSAMFATDLGVDVTQCNYGVSEQIHRAFRA